MIRPLVLLLLVASPARAAPQTSPIVDRGYDMDLFIGAALGSPRTIAMGGAATALAEGAGGLLGNPGAIGIRPIESRDTWDWDATLSGATPGLGSDFDNNGLPASASASVSHLGLLGYYGGWALGLGGGSVEYSITPPAPPGETPVPVLASSNLARVVLARAFGEGAASLGIGLRIASFSLREEAGDLFELQGYAVETGVLVAPPRRWWRAGGRVALPVRGDSVSGDCDPGACRGRILPAGVASPWEVAVGAAVRLGPTAWNGYRGPRFRDERALVLAADLIAVGALDNASGLEAFAAGQLQASGRRTTLSVRLGGEEEWLPGRLRVRAGTYFEPSRFAGVAGRPHATAGAEVRIVAFHLWGLERRLAASVATDAAPRYFSLGASLGLWH